MSRRGQALSSREKLGDSADKAPSQQQQQSSGSAETPQPAGGGGVGGSVVDTLGSS